MAKIVFQKLTPAAMAFPCSLATLAQNAADALIRLPGHTVTVQEATTGGLVSAALLSAPGASKYYRNGAVIYSRKSHNSLVSETLLQELADPDYLVDAASYRKSKERWTVQVARHLRSVAGTTWCIAESGACGPTFAVPDVHTGFSAICVSGPVEKAVMVESSHADREANMWLFTKAALDLLTECLLEAEQMKTEEAKASDSPNVDSNPLAGVIPFKEDRYGGIIIEMHDEAYSSAEQFAAALDYALAQWKQQGKRGCWMTLPSTCAELVPICIQQGFKYHHAKETYCTLTQWLPGDSQPNKLPHFANTQLGVGGCVLNCKNEILLVTERVSPVASGQGLWKLPGGMADPGESIHNCAAREVWEETGVRAEAQSIICFRHAHGYRFGMDDFYFVVRMQCPEGKEALHIDQREIGDARWMTREEVNSLHKEGRVSETNKYIIDLAFDETSKIVGRSLPSLRGPPAVVFSAQL